MPPTRSPECVPEAHIAFQTRLQDSPKITWESSNLQGERGDLWICEYICNQKLHLSGSETCFPQLDDGAWPPYQVLSWSSHDFARPAAYLPSNKHN